MINIEQVLNLVIKPSLQIVDLDSISAQRLVLFTGMVESGYANIAQLKGPAMGFWQVENRTHLDVKKWLGRTENKRLKQSVLAATYMDILPDDSPLIWNMRYCCLICRIIYYRYSEPLPQPDDAAGMARYHKRYYNGLGKADPIKNEQVFRDMFDIKGYQDNGAI